MFYVHYDNAISIQKKTGDNPGRKLGIKYRNFGAYIE
jgi:hypothetical protein